MQNLTCQILFTTFILMPILEPCRANNQRGFFPIPIIIIVSALFLGGVAVSTGVINIGLNKSTKPKPAPSGYSQTDYKNEEEGISVNLPGSEWTRKDGSGETLSSFLAPKEGSSDQFIENITLDVVDLSSKPDTTRKEIMEQWIGNSKKDAPDFKTLERIIVTYGGEDGEQVTYSASQDNISLKGRVVVILHGRKAYIVHYIAEDKSFEKYLSGMTNILQSLKFETPKISWQSYKNDQYGYSLEYPKGWVVKDQSGEDKREILIMAPGNLANALIASRKDESLKDKASMESAMAARKEFKQSESGLKIANFKSQAEDKKAGWMLIGEKTIDGQKWAVMERGLLDIYGKVVIQQSGYLLDGGKDYKDVVIKILDSFQVE